MTDPNGPNTEGQPGAGDAPERPQAPQRQASVQLRRETPEGDTPAGFASRMDPANQSLGDALKITFRLLQAAMVVLAFLFIASGFQSVSEGERGITLRFGRPTATDISPGAVFGWPYPFGELVKVSTGAVEMRIDRAFFQQFEGDAATISVDNLRQRSSLHPVRDGSNITADLNLAHTQWTIVYRRMFTGQYAENILPEQEARLVRLAVQRAVVHAIAEINIDDLLMQSRADVNSVEARARADAQAFLDALESGIAIEQVTMSRRIPPTQLRDEFNAVQNAQTEANQVRTNALSERDSTLQSVAGSAAPALISLIGRYELAVEREDEEEADEILAVIDAVLEGRGASWGERTYAAGLVSGQITEVLNAARNDAFRTVRRAEAELDVFNAKLAQFRANPRVMVMRDWAAAYDEFMNKPFVQTMLLPERITGEILINPDPDIVRQLDRERMRAEGQRAFEERERQRIIDRARQDREMQPMGTR